MIAIIILDMTDRELEQMKQEAIKALINDGYSLDEIELLFSYLHAIIDPLFDEYFDRPYEEFLKQLDDLCL